VTLEEIDEALGALQAMRERPADAFVTLRDLVASHPSLSLRTKSESALISVCGPITFDKPAGGVSCQRRRLGTNRH
jgi:hypothetical protein